MNKYNLLIMSILLFVLSFVVSWYGDQMLDSLLLLVIPIDIALIICWIVLLVLSIRKIKKDRAYINYITIAVLVLLYITIVFFPFREAKVKLELYAYEADRTKVVEMVKDYNIQLDEDGMDYVLPAEYKHLSSDGEVYLYENDERGQVIGFWIFRGLSIGGSAQLVYSSGDDGLVRMNIEYIKYIEKLKDIWYYVETE